MPERPVAVAALPLGFMAWMGQRRGQSAQPTYSVLQAARGTFQLWPLPFQEVALGQPCCGHGAEGVLVGWVYVGGGGFMKLAMMLNSESRAPVLWGRGLRCW